MQHDHILKKLNFYPRVPPTPKVHPVGPNKALKLKSGLICFISIVPLHACKILVKIIDCIIIAYSKSRVITQVLIDYDERISTVHGTYHLYQECFKSDQ